MKPTAYSLADDRADAGLSIGQVVTLCAVRGRPEITRQTLIDLESGALDDEGLAEWLRAEIYQPMPDGLRDALAACKSEGSLAPLQRYVGTLDYGDATEAPHDLRLRLVQRPGPMTDNIVSMVVGAVRGYCTAGGPADGRAGRVILVGWLLTPATAQQLAALAAQLLAELGASVHVRVDADGHPEGPSLVLTPAAN